MTKTEMLKAFEKMLNFHNRHKFESGYEILMKMWPDYEARTLPDIGKFTVLTSDSNIYDAFRYIEHDFYGDKLEWCRFFMSNTITQLRLDIEYNGDFHDQKRA